MCLLVIGDVLSGSILDNICQTRDVNSIHHEWDKGLVSNRRPSSLFFFFFLGGGAIFSVTDYLRDDGSPSPKIVINLS